MKILRENPIKMDLRGRPRWWTVSVKGRVWECVRVSAGDSVAFRWFLFVPPGAYRWPPLAAAALMAGGLDSLLADGVKIILGESDAGARLEERLTGVVAPAWTVSQDAEA